MWLCGLKELSNVSIPYSFKRLGLVCAHKELHVFCLTQVPLVMQPSVICIQLAQTRPQIALSAWESLECLP